MEKIQKIHVDSKPKIGITHGDINGIGYEVIIKALRDHRVTENFTPVVYGHSKIASYHRKSIDAEDFNFQGTKNAESAIPRKPNLINCSDQNVKIELGKASPIAGEMALISLEKATGDLKKGVIDALVTAPINKENIQSEHFDFPGHTEYLAQKFGNTDYMMLMVSHGLRIGVATGHIPLSEVPGAINAELIMKKVRIMNRSLIRDFNIGKPKIAVLGLNPHSGERGLLGAEEEHVLTPAITALFEEGNFVYGPYPADGFFGTDTYTKFDGILAMYHDQGMIPFKTLAFRDGVNFTAGLPVVRTSPAHGTAYDLAGRNLADPEPMRSAIFTALDIIRNRREFDELSKNPLPVTTGEDDHANTSEKRNNNQ